MSEDCAEVAAIFAEDQADRRAGFGPDTIERDQRRHGRVLELIDAGSVRTGIDHFHAAMVLQHGHVVASFRMANQLARTARRLGDERGAWLAAAAYDRWLTVQGRPQYFATQYRERDGQWVLVDVDPAASDDIRARWNAPTLAEAIARVDELNAEQPFASAAGSPTSVGSTKGRTTPPYARDEIELEQPREWIDC